jgi:hypothetical protein
VVAVPSLRRLARAAPLVALLGAAACGSGEEAAKGDPPALSADPGADLPAASAESPAEVTPPKPDPQVTPAHLERASLRVLGMS